VGWADGVGAESPRAPAGTAWGGASADSGGGITAPGVNPGRPAPKSECAASEAVSTAGAKGRSGGGAPVECRPGRLALGGCADWQRPDAAYALAPTTPCKQPAPAGRARLADSPEASQAGDAPAAPPEQPAAPRQAACCGGGAPKSAAGLAAARAWLHRMGAGAGAQGADAEALTASQVAAVWLQAASAGAAAPAQVAAEPAAAHPTIAWLRCMAARGLPAEPRAAPEADRAWLRGAGAIQGGPAETLAAVRAAHGWLCGLKPQRASGGPTATSQAAREWLCVVGAPAATVCRKSDSECAEAGGASAAAGAVASAERQRQGGGGAGRARAEQCRASAAGPDVGGAQRAQWQGRLKLVAAAAAGAALAALLGEARARRRAQSSHSAPLSCTQHKQMARDGTRQRCTRDIVAPALGQDLVLCHAAGCYV